ncbi:MAG: PqqD family protein [Oscillospiraceae bacterium]|nr:PqqD family protein [Oscillospiraceae bacterium]
MKLKREFIAHSGAGESLLVPSGGAEFVGIVRGNQTFGAILELLKENTDEDAVVSAMCQRFHGDRELIAGDVHRAIEGLRSIGALEE